MAAMMNRKSFLRRLREDSGAELIELAIVTPILLMLVAGIFDFGMMFRAWEIVTNAAREGARVGVLPAYTLDDNVRIRVEQYMQASGAATSCSLGCSPGVCSVCVFLKNEPIGTGPATVQTRVVTVYATQQLPSLSVIGQFFGGSFGTINLTGSAQMRVEQPYTP